MPYLYILNDSWVSVYIHLSYKLCGAQPREVLCTIVTKELLKYLFSLLIQHTYLLSTNLCQSLC